MDECNLCNKRFDKINLYSCNIHCDKLFCSLCINDHVYAELTNNTSKNNDNNYAKSNSINLFPLNKNFSNLSQSPNASPDQNRKYSNNEKEVLIEALPKISPLLQNYANNNHSTNNIVSSKINYVDKDRTEKHSMTTQGEFRDTLENKEFYSLDNFEFMMICNKRQSLGSGAFGEVFLARHVIENKKYAIKIMNKEKLLKNEVNMRFVNREIDIHSKLDHPYIIGLKNYHEDSENFYLIMDYAKNGTLYSKIRKMKNGFSEETAFKYFIQTCSSIYFLHKYKLAHRDLKPENLLLDDSNNIKLSDFGWCDYFSLDSNFYDICGTYEYMAPEIVKEQPYTELVDNWSLGVLLYELLHGKSPFFVDGLYDNQKATKKLFSKILTNDYRINEALSNPCKNLIQGKFYFFILFFQHCFKLILVIDYL